MVMTRSAESPAFATLRDGTQLSQRLGETRRLSLDLVQTLSAEDMTVQVMPDASPTKWHLAHVTWFFETFVLLRFARGYRLFDENYNYCFNSYYESQGGRQPRHARGVLTRPSTEQVLAYRAHVDEALAQLLAPDAATDPEALRLVEIGINHEQQHQELLLTDILALFASNPLRPAYRPMSPALHAVEPVTLGWIEHARGIHDVGHAGPGFSWDNEGPRHEALVHGFRLADRLVTNAEWADFIEDGGYRTASLWLADGWGLANREQWSAPLYWEWRDGCWHVMSLSGVGPIDDEAPVAHISYYEADAYARWAGKRLPTEFEWEVAAQSIPLAGNMLSRGASGLSSMRPLPAPRAIAGLARQMFGDVWEWTQSAYLPYPGYKPPQGAIGEYNGKFMVSQHVLRGASCVTPEGHTRRTYRNFFYPHQRWQFSGLRLASDLS